MNGEAMKRTLRVALAAATLAGSLVLVATALADLGALRDLSKLFSDTPVIVNSRAGRFIVRGAHMVPGQKVYGQVRIRNKGSRTAALYVRPRRSLDTPGPGGGVLSTRLMLTIRRIRRDGGLHTVWKGYIESMGRVRVGTLRPGAVRRYRFVVVFRMRPPVRAVMGDDRFKQSRFTTDFVWRLVPVQ